MSQTQIEPTVDRRRQEKRLSVATGLMGPLPKDVEKGSAALGAVGGLVLSAAIPMLSARAMVAREWGGEGTGRTLHHEGGGFLEWDGQRYVDLEPDVARGLVWQFLERAKTPRAKGEGTEDFNPTKPKVANVLEALASVVQLRDRQGEGWPRWRETCCPRGWC